MKLILGHKQPTYKSADEAYNRLTERDDLVFLKLPFNSELLKGASQWAQSIHNQNQDHLFVIGLGGSFLGAKAILSSLANQGKVDFLFSLDKRFLESQLASKPIENSHFLVISKSGSTLEILSITNFIIDHLNKSQLDASKHISVITDPQKSALSDLADRLSLTKIPHPIDVGGRFSVFSSVGIYPCAFANINTAELFEGAKKAFTSSFVCEASDYLYQQIKDKKSVSVFWPYNDRLYDFGLWLIQLWGESLTKKIDRDGNIPLTNTTPTLCIGTRDQHSLLQNFIEGRKDVHIIFFKELLKSSTKSKNYFSEIPALNYSLEEQLNASQLGTLQSLQESGIETAMIEHDEISAFTMGEMLMSFELVIATLGEMLNINAYDQPGVERAKVICREILK